ncbi:hypothetical protein GCM10009836_04150 [Pseudonocardia ailaonensis]|uniref:Uncharacterized protein n=1 Tax=Pseudonocardia ailaonensis TaxID=367279 RepID=A0ABN2MJP4_9PSEU
MTLLPGHHLYPTPDGWRAALPGDRFVRIDGPDELLSAFQRAAHGHDGPPDRATDAEQLHRFFAERGLLADPEPEPAPPRVLLTGDGPVADAVAAVLGAWARVRRAGRPTEVDLLVDCAGWLPDARWHDLDTTCAATGLPWHRCHAEGTSFLVGPLTVPGRSPGYRDLRGRRLAASGVPDELGRYWSWLDTAQAPPVPDPGPGVAAVVAGLLADEVAAWWRTGETGPVGYQTEVSTNPVRLTRHPVLALPGLAAVDPA